MLASWNDTFDTVKNQPAVITRINRQSELVLAIPCTHLSSSTGHGQPALVAKRYWRGGNVRMGRPRCTSSSALPPRRYDLSSQSSAFLIILQRQANLWPTWMLSWRFPICSSKPSKRSVWLACQLTFLSIPNLYFRQELPHIPLSRSVSERAPIV